MPKAVYPWRNWYHCMGNTYGTWPPGDARGFRTRHHHEHVEGDYKLPPPPGFYEQRFQTSRDLMKRDAVLLDEPERAWICRLFRQRLAHYQVQIVELSISTMHFHLLGRFVPVGVDPYQHLESLGVKLTHPRAEVNPRRGRRGLSAYDHDPVPRRVLGLVREYTSRQSPYRGGLWAKRPLALPIQDRGHQLAVAQYIRDHTHEGAAVWSLLDHES